MQMPAVLMPAVEAMVTEGLLSPLLLLSDNVDHVRGRDDSLLLFPLSTLLPLLAAQTAADEDASAAATAAATCLRTRYPSLHV